MVVTLQIRRSEMLGVDIRHYWLANAEPILARINTNGCKAEGAFLGEW